MDIYLVTTLTHVCATVRRDRMRLSTVEELGEDRRRRRHASSTCACTRHRQLLMYNSDCSTAENWKSWIACCLASLIATQLPLVTSLTPAVLPSPETLLGTEMEIKLPQTPPKKMRENVGNLQVKAQLMRPLSF